MACMTMSIGEGSNGWWQQRAASCGCASTHKCPINSCAHINYWRSSCAQTCAVHMAAGGDYAAADTVIIMMQHQQILLAQPAACHCCCCPLLLLQWPPGICRTDRRAAVHASPPMGAGASLCCVIVLRHCLHQPHQTDWTSDCACVCMYVCRESIYAHICTNAHVCMYIPALWARCLFTCLPYSPCLPTSCLPAPHHPH